MLLIGLDIGGTKCAAILGEGDADNMHILSRRAFPTPPAWRDALAGLFDCAKALLQERGLSRPDAVGISCGGPLDAQKGLILSPPNLPGWDNVPVVAMAEEALGAPAYLENDANACAMAEWRYGAGRGTRSMAFLTFGTGLGAGLILDGRLYRGANGNAGELGHMRLSSFGPVGYGKMGSFEGFCSGGGIAQLAAMLGREQVQRGTPPAYFTGNWETLTTKDVAEAARAGDETAIAVFEKVGEKLGEGLSLLVDVINPEAIVIGSVFVRCQDLLVPAMEKALKRECLPASLSVVRILPAQLGESAPDMAALVVAASR